MTAPAAEHAPARRMAVAGTLLEVLAERRLDQPGRIERTSYGEGRAALLLRCGQLLGIGGAAVAATVGRRWGWAARAGGAGLVLGSLATRFGVFEAGRSSAGDPAQVVGPQRAGLTGT